MSMKQGFYRLPEDLMGKLEDEADKDNRKVSNYVATLLTKHLDGTQRIGGNDGNDSTAAAN